MICKMVAIKSSLKFKGGHMAVTSRLQLLEQRVWKGVREMKYIPEKLVPKEFTVKATIKKNGELQNIHIEPSLRAVRLSSSPSPRVDKFVKDFLRKAF